MVTQDVCHASCWTRLGPALKEFGCDTELFKAYRMIAVNVPHSVRLQSVQESLQHGLDEERWEYEEPILRQ